MKKKLLSLFLCLCLLIGAASLPAGIFAFAEEGYVVAELNYMINGELTVNSYKELVSKPQTFDPPVDLTALGYENGSLALQIDYYAEGDLEMVTACSGQIELSSSGTGDVEELYVNTSDLHFVNGEWVRQVFPLSSFHTTGGAFRPQNLNYMRVYFVGLQEEYVGKQITLKIARVRIVDTSKTAPTEEEDPLGIIMSSEGYVLAELNYMVNGVQTVNGYRELISQPQIFDTPIDLTALGYDTGNLGLQIDYYALGDISMLSSASGQIELSSSGKGDNEELYVNTNELHFKNGEWVRQVFPLSLFHTTGGAFRPQNLNYMRIYFVGLDEKYVDEQITVKIGRVRIVDTSKMAPDPQDDPLGFTVDTEGYVVKDLKFRITGTKTVGASGGGTMIAELAISFDDPLNFVEMVGEDWRSILGLQADLYTYGNIDAAKASYGQVEFTSSGMRDAEEYSTGSDRFSWKEGAWMRQVLPLSTFGYQSTSENEFDPSHVIYFRMYFHTKSDYLGERLTFKVCNVRLVDLRKGAPTFDEDPLGDGSFRPEAPVWREIKVGEEFQNDDIVVAGYDLGDYLEPGTDKDATPYIQSLLDGLENAGGGTLFIPAGEYRCEGQISVPTCTTIYGEWQSPEISPAVGGTVLKAYNDAGNAGGSPFIQLGSNCMVANLTVWYPEQNYIDPTPYPPTCHGGSHYQIKNMTFVNSYYILQQGPGMSGCPNVTNVYGTPLFVGIDMDGVADIGRLDEIHLDPKYWIESGLPGAPAGEAETRFRKLMRSYGTGVILRRIDWSYLTFTDIIGYATGLLFDISNCTECFEGEKRIKYDFPNGHCYGLNFDNCNTAIYVNGTSEWGYGEMVTSSVIRNCTNGIIIADYPEANGGNVEFSDLDISAADAAFIQQGVVKANMMSCRIRSGEVLGQNGVFALTNNVFFTEGPQVVLENGTCSAVLVGNRTDEGEPIEYVNEGLCPVAYDETPLDVEEIPSVTAEEAARPLKQPARRVVKIVTELDNTGVTDVTDALNQILSDMGTAGGGLVYLPNGVYRLNGSVTVPSGVELKGACDMGRIPYNAGTILAAYGGQGDPQAPATVILKANAGIRGITIDHPEQYPYASDFVSYPYVIQGQGEGVYVINVALRNAWDGLDLMSYRCDGHYVEYLAGICLHNSIKVGGGSVGGYIRDFQFNYGALLKGADTGNGAWANSPAREEMDAFEVKMKLQIQNDATVVLVGDVKDQVFFDNFNYSGHYGVELVEENGKAGEVVFYGHGCDYCNVPVRVDKADKAVFVNLQTTAFNYNSDVVIEHPLYNIEFDEDFTGTVNVFNMNTWAPPAAIFHILGGTLNLYGGNLAYTGGSLAEMGEKGTLKLNATLFNRGGKLIFTEENQENVFVNTGITVGEYRDAELLSEYKNVISRVTRWDAPTNAEFDPASAMLFTEAFTAYSSASIRSFDLEFGDDSTVTARSNRIQVHLGSIPMAAGIRNSKFAMNSGKADSLYRLETRVKISSLRDRPFSKALIMLYSSNGESAILASFEKDGVLLGGDRQVAGYETEVWYRVAVEIDARNGNAKTYRVCLMDDDYGLIGISDPIPFDDGVQGTQVRFNSLWIGLAADPGGEADNTADMEIDYVFATYADHSTFTAKGDADGDGSITSTDARLTLQLAVGKIGEEDVANPSCLDVDGNGSINTTDARLILQYVAGKHPTFPAA